MKWVLLLALSTLLSLPLVAPAQWSAFNDQWKGPDSHPNATFYTTAGLYSGADNSGPLTNIVTGEALPVTVLITNYGQMDAAGLMIAPLPNTPAMNIFGPYIDWDNGTANNGIHLFPTNVIGYVFDGLDLSKTYKFIATSVRGGVPGAAGPNYYSNRWTRAQLVGASSYVPAHSAGILTSNDFPRDLMGNQVALMSGVNTNGAVIEWDNIVPQPGTNGGTFTVLCAKYSGHYLQDDPNTTANASYSYALSAFKLVEDSTTLAITLLAPTNGAGFPGESDVLVTAEASQATNVGFYMDDLFLGNCAAPPASLIISSIAPGTHQLYALAQDATGNLAYSATNTITVSNLPLSITLTSPTNGQPVAYGAAADLRVKATGATNVAFYLDGAFLVDAGAPPYVASASNLELGPHTFYAVARDENGNSLFSSTNTFIVANLSITLLSPFNGQVFVACAAIRITNLLEGAPSNVVFYLDNVPVGNRTFPPWYLTLPTSIPGWHSVYAVAQDAGGASAATGTNYFFQNANVLPAVVITNTYSSGLTNAPGRAYLVGACITNQLALSDPDDAITNIEWYVNGHLRVRIPPAYNQKIILLNDALAGTNWLCAVAWDSCGACWTSAPVAVVVTNPPPTTHILVPNGSTWSYYVDTHAPTNDLNGLAWYELNYDDSAWPAGAAELGGGDANRGTQANNPETTLLALTNGSPFHSYYFRRTFTVTNASRYTNLTVRVLRDDGAVIFLNGVELCRSGVNNAIITHDSVTGYSAAPDNGTVYYQSNLSQFNLKSGTNVLAVQVLQSTNTSPDISFDLMLWAQGTFLPDVVLGVSRLPGPAIGLWWTNSLFRPYYTTNLDLPRAYWLPLADTDWLSASTNANDRVDLQLPCPSPACFYELRRP